ncbi:MAG TPA: M20/M25/M40 family metallo-hydrolase [Verrucomicrobiae bacterium]|nr:M20/M25/M40 family metallo-hydrolase [Verrucomicrobiae bacterium]
MPATVALLVLTSCAVVPRNPRFDYEALAEHDDTAYDLARSLTSEVGSRFAGTEGDKRAVGWALRTLKEQGFSNVRAEPVTVPVWNRGSIAVELRGSAPRALDAVALGGSVPTPDAGIEAAVLSVESVEALQKLPDAAVRGRIVYFGARIERTHDNSGYRKAAPTRRQGPVVAGRKGAASHDSPGQFAVAHVRECRPLRIIPVAVLLRSIGTDTDGPPHTGRVAYEADAPKIPAAALAAASADALDAAVAAGTTRARIAIGSSYGPDAQSANVIGEIPGAGNEIVLLGAHLDSWDNTPGANDDAAGVGIVIAAAKRIASLGRQPARTLRVVLFANEEFGASGAKAYVKAYAAELPRHAIAMEADSGSSAVIELNGWVADADWAWTRSVATKLTLVPGVNGREGGIDVAELRKLGVPELIATQDATHYFDVHHTAADTVDTLDSAGLSQATTVFATIAHAASQRPEAFVRVTPATK